MSEKKLNRRDFIKAASFVTAGGILAACAPQQATQSASSTVEPTMPAAEEPTVEPSPTPIVIPPSKEGKTVRYWTGWGGGPYTKAFQSIMALDSFKAVLGNNGFELKTGIPEEAMLTAVAGGDPPDVGTNINYLGFMARGALQPIDDLVAASTETKKENYIESNWNLGMYKGVLYGLPTQECFLRYGLLYNSQLVQEAGLDPNSPPETWDDLFAWHQKLTKKDSAGNVTQVGANPYGSMGGGWWDTDGAMVTTSFDINWFDENTGKFDLNNEKLVEAFKTFRDFVKEIGVDQVGAFYGVSGRDDWEGAYLAGVESAQFQGYWAPGEFASSNPDISKLTKGSWLPVPASRKGKKVQLSGGHTWTIFKDSQSPEAAFKIGEYMNTNEPCQVMWDTQGWLPAIKTFLDQADPTKYPGLDFYFTSYKDANEWHTPPRCEITSFVSNEYMSLKEKVNRDEMTAEEAAAELQTRATEEYKNQGFAK